ncbi:MAG: hypothetical protein EP338_09175 [Bacteroidetes bacterium]|nr:MAG: hypothetical protein EP338_09175 [Bacteroidota bacterium]
MIDRLHVVVFDVPVPPDYGGVIDVYYRLRALRKQGVSMVLHVFEYGRGRDGNYEEIADEVYFYQRQKSWFDQLSILPFIVKSRWNNLLFKRLLSEDAPILLEGHHACACLLDRRFRNRSIFVRIHNVEHHYYEALAQKSKGLKKLYYRLESWKLRRFDQFLSRASALFCLSKADQDYYKAYHQECHLWELGLDIDLASRVSVEQKDQLLFHGNLSVEENERVALELIDWWSREKVDLPLVLAGKNPSKRIQKELAQVKGVHLVANPSNEELYDLIASSLWNIALTDQATGMKIKLLHILLLSGRCLANDKMISGTDLEVMTTRIDGVKSITNSLIKTNKIVNSLHRQELLRRFDPQLGAQYFLEKCQANAVKKS